MRTRAPRGQRVSRDVPATSRQRLEDSLRPGQDPERVERPDGKVWVHDTRSAGRKVFVEPSAAGPVLLVLCTHDREKAADMVSVRWPAFFPGVPIPAGDLEWRRRAIETWVGQTTIRQKAIEASTGTESLSFPVVAFRPPAVTT